jgi:diguanylate cyclase (GGDEF)-like protein
MSAHSSDDIHPLFREGNLEGYRRRLIRLWAWVSLFSLGLIFAVVQLLPQGTVRWPSVYTVLGAGLLTTVALVIVPWPRYRPEWLLSIVALTVAQIIGLIFTTGGGESPFFPLYLFVIILSAAYFTGPALAVAVAFVVAGSVGNHLTEPPTYSDLVEHLISVSVYVVAALVANLLFKGLKRSYARAQSQAEVCKTLYEASRLIHGESKSEPLFQKLLELARRATGAQYAALRTFDVAGGLTGFYHSGLSEEQLRHLKEPPLDVGVLGAITASDPPLRLEDLTRDPRHKGFPPHHPVMRSFLGVPITLRDRLLGKLYLTEKAGGRPFTLDDESLVATLAWDVAVAIEKLFLMEKIQTLAVTDGLTALYNHRTFQERLREEIGRAQRYSFTCSLLMIDVDDFKMINDRYGHLIGDGVLKSIAGAFQKFMRKVDVPARYGGEEFAIILPESDKKGAFVIAERLRAAVENFRFKASDGQTLHITISIGVAAYPEDADSPNALIGAADDALYEAKRSGKNRVAT